MEMTSHADIRIKRVIGGEEVFFVGFIHDDDEYDVSNKIMLECVHSAGFKPISDSEFLHRNRNDWANDYELAPYYVITGEQIRSGSNNLICCFFDYDRERYWYRLDAPFSRNCLMACRA